MRSAAVARQGCVNLAQCARRAPFAGAAVDHRARLLLFALFIAWLLTARALYISLFGDVVPASIGGLLSQVFGTSAGWTLLIAGNLIGLCFAVVVLATTVVAFPLLLDRDTGAVAAIQTSVRATLANRSPCWHGA